MINGRRVTRGRQFISTNVLSRSSPLPLTLTSSWNKARHVCLRYVLVLTGKAGPRGFTGPKGDPGESISLPKAIISPKTQIVTKNQTATFYCSASGNPRPTVSWRKVNGSLIKEHVVSDENSSRIEVIYSTFNDSGDYLCTAVNLLGRDEAVAKLIVEGRSAPNFLDFHVLFLVIFHGVFMFWYTLFQTYSHFSNLNLCYLYSKYD